jgi:hypothetical protein
MRHHDDPILGRLRQIHDVSRWHSRVRWTLTVRFPQHLNSGIDHLKSLSHWRLGQLGLVTELQIIPDESAEFLDQ